MSNRNKSDENQNKAKDEAKSNESTTAKDNNAEPSNPSKDSTKTNNAVASNSTNPQLKSGDTPKSANKNEVKPASETKAAATKSTDKPQPSSQSTANSEKSSVKEKSSRNETKPEPRKVEKTKTGALWFFTILNFLLLFGIVGAGYWFWLQLESEKGEQVTSIDTLESRLTNNEQETRNLNNATREIRNNQNSLENTVDSSLDSILADVSLSKETNDALQKRVAEISGRRPSDWLLAEADYLVNMAGRKLYLEDDVKTAVTLLAEADSRIEDLNDPALFPVRTLIASDIATLNQVNNVSETSVSLAVGGLIPQVAKLPLRTLTLPEPPAPLQTTPSSDIKEWRENLVRVWNDLTDDLVNKTPIDGPIAPYLSESERWLIEQQLKYALSRAQSAALDRQTEVFEQNLLESVSLIDQHYELDDVGVRQFLGAIENLLNTDFSKEYPENLQAQEAIKDILDQRVDALFNNGGNTL